ncbi:acylphosphatase-2 isoform X2 [Puntigrus tetrazona]|uniref:acylphosphatase-2 isoform X2 n=1 Tax=Puntigrus tetrazona TaxID=1606681 RepID=UPI001C8A7D97|nr:acylphosphatase-2 isoform X2 [Puntigrus tetrazona]
MPGDGRTKAVVGNAGGQARDGWDAARMTGLSRREKSYTEQEAKKLGLTGWVKNTRQGTVVGQVQGHPERVKEMKYWLSKVGSPSSRIHRAQFTDEKPITKLEIHGFGTRY